MTGNAKYSIKKKIIKVKIILLKIMESFLKLDWKGFTVSGHHSYNFL